MRSKFLELQETIRPGRRVDAKIEFSESSRASQKTHLWIEIFAVLLVTAHNALCWGTISRRKIERVVTTGTTWCLGSSNKTLYQAVVADAPAAIKSKGAIVVMSTSIGYGRQKDHQGRIDWASHGVRVRR